MEIGHINSVITVFRERMLPCHIWNSVFTVFRRRQSLSVRVDGQSLSVRGYNNNNNTTELQTPGIQGAKIC